MVMVDVNGIWWAADSPPHPQLSKNILSPPKSVLEAGGFWLKAVMDCGNSCKSRLRMKMRMTVDWQSTLMARLSLLPKGMTVCGKHMVHRHASTHWPVCYCWEELPEMVLLLPASKSWAVFWFIDEALKKKEFYLIFSNKLNINHKMQLEDVAWNYSNAGHLTCSEHTQTHTLCRRMHTVSLQWFT